MCLLWSSKCERWSKQIIILTIIHGGTRCYRGHTTAWPRGTAGHIKSAYRRVLIHYDDHWLMGMIWNWPYSLPFFGLRLALKIFTTLVDAAEWILCKAGVNFIIHLLPE